MSRTSAQIQCKLNFTFCEVCDERVGISLSVRFSARISQKPRVQTSRNFLYPLAVAVARSSCDDNAIRCVLLVLWMTSCLPIIAQAKATPIGHILKVTQQGAETGRSVMSVNTLLLLLMSVTN